VRHLPERHAQKLLPTAKVPGSPVAGVPLNTTVEFVVIDERHYLGKNVFAVIHIVTNGTKPYDYQNGFQIV
jgi:hypothetical protein